MTKNERTALFMKRFHGRTDVYARKWYDKEGKGNYSPVCQNVWKDKCHIKLKDGIGCSKCEIREFAPVTDESVWKHISGSEEHSIYVIKENGMIDFGAIDFDCKPNRDPKTSYFFEDVKKTADVCDELGIKYVLARSTSGGFHLYIFFDKEYPAAKFLAVIQSLVFERTGFAENRRLNVRLPPEVFPKQTSPGGQGGLGNPIKPPMIEARWGAERNCLIDKDNVMIPADQQWEYLAKAPINTAETFDGLLEYYGIEVREEIQRVVSVSGKVIRVGGGVYNKDTGEWSPPTEGSMEKLVEGCAAFRRLREKMDTGYQPSHDEGFALFHCGALHTQDGMKYFQDGKVPGWGATDKDWKQLMQSVDKNYSPWTCRKMQEKGICIPGTKCFNKLPPTEMIEGQKVTNPNNLPEDQWPDPSPMRYSKGIGDEFLAKLTREVDALDSETDTEKQVVKIREIVARAQVFDKDQQTILKKHIEKKGFMKPRELGKVFNQAEKEKTEELTKTAASRSDTHLVNGKLYRKLKPYGYAVSSKVKGNSEGFSSLSNFDMVITEIKSVVEDDEILPKAKYYRGIFLYDGCEKPFEIEATRFYDNTELYKMIGSALDMRAGVQKSDMEDFRMAVQSFSSSPKETKIYSCSGWDKDGQYRTRSLMIGRDIRANSTHQIVNPQNASIVRQIDFQDVSRGEIPKIVHHILSDFKMAFSEGAVAIGIGHNISALIATPMRYQTHPTLWYLGGISTFKTSLCFLLMRFWGPYESFLKWSEVSSLALISHGYQHRDAVLLVDDFKPESCDPQIAHRAIQNSFDRSVESKMQRDGSHRQSYRFRCRLLGNGEEIAGEVESVISRTIMVNMRIAPEGSSLLYEKCRDWQDKYAGVFPHFLVWFQQQNRDHFEKRYRELQRDFRLKVLGKQASNRIADSMAQNALGWSLFLKFSVDIEAISPQQEEELWQCYLEAIVDAGRNTAERCGEEQQAQIFLDSLLGLIKTSALIIRGTTSGNGRVIGYYDPQKDPDHALLEIAITIASVTQAMPSRKFLFNKHQLARQLRTHGFINGPSKQERASGASAEEKKGENGRLWRVPLDRLFDEDQIRVFRRIAPVYGREMERLHQEAECREMLLSARSPDLPPSDS